MQLCQEKENDIFFTIEDLKNGLIPGIADVHVETKDISSQKPTYTSIELKPEIQHITFLHVLEFIYTGKGTPFYCYKGQRIRFMY